MDSHDVRQEWAGRSGEFSPGYYAHYGPNETSGAIRAVLERHVGREAAVLELGCSSGRHLAHLHEAGFTDLHGIDVNEDAIDVMGDAYPDLAAAGTFHVGAIENVVDSFPDDRFDAVYSVETLQHVHPDADWVFAELARITGDLLVTVENEGSVGVDGGDADGAVNYVTEEIPLYYRDWGGVFTDRGLEAVDARDLDRDRMRTFRQPSA